MDLMTYCSKPHGIEKPWRVRRRKGQKDACVDFSMSVFIHELLPHGKLFSMVLWAKNGNKIKGWAYRVYIWNFFGGENLRPISFSQTPITLPVKSRLPPFWKKVLKIGGIEKLSLLESVILEVFFCFIPMKISQSSLGSKDGSKLPWFPAQKNSCLNICNTVYVKRHDHMIPA